MNMYEKFNFAVKLLVEANLERQSELRSEIPGMSGKGWSKDFCTVKAASGRRCGTSLTGLDIAHSMFKEPLVVCASVAQADCVRKSRSKHFPLSTVKVEHIGTVDRLAGIYPDAIIVDCASIISDSKIDKLYDFFGPMALERDFCFVLLG